MSNAIHMDVEAVKDEIAVIEMLAQEVDASETIVERLQNIVQRLDMMLLDNPLPVPE